ncbi:L,D-transpeptidase [Caballeronia glebae]|uniref:L,D-transpeptidase n=1 Tax=Caballeronia glebae TaxID=1777143 RepID=UPI0038BA46CD
MPSKAAADLSAKAVVPGPAPAPDPWKALSVADAIRVIQAQASTSYSVNPVIEPHDGKTTGPVLPAGFSFDTASAPDSAPSICSKAKLIICVDKTTYVATVYKNGTAQWSYYVRPGDARGERYATGEGHGHIAYKSRNHVSNTYGTPMPYAMFISWDRDHHKHAGEAFHLSYDFQNQGYEGASHGCMGVGSEAVMKRLWETSPVGTRVYVYRT